MSDEGHSIRRPDRRLQDQREKGVRPNKYKFITIRLTNMRYWINIQNFLWKFYSCFPLTILLQYLIDKELENKFHSYNFNINIPKLFEGWLGSYSANYGCLVLVITCCVILPPQVIIPNHDWQPAKSFLGPQSSRLTRWFKFWKFQWNAQLTIMTIRNRIHLMNYLDGSIYL